MKLQYFPKETTDIIFEEVEELVKSKTDILIVDIGNIDTAKGKNVLANAEKFLKK